MNCKFCGYQIPNEETKSCPSCGKAIEKEIPKIDIAKIQKNLKTTGTSISALGWLTLVGNVGLYVYSLLDTNYLKSGLPKIDTSGTVPVVAFSIIYIILGKRIAKLVDRNIKRYLQILLILSALVLVWVLYSDGRIGVLFILVIGYLISSLIAINKAMKSEEFKSTLITPQYTFNKIAWVIFGISTLVLFFAAIKFDVYRIKTGRYLSHTKKEFIESIIQVAKSDYTLPRQIDEYTKIVDITPESNAIRYHYVLSGVDETKLSNVNFKEYLTNTACDNPDTVKIFDEGIALEFSYIVDNSSQTYFVTLTKSDCLQ